MPVRSNTQSSAASTVAGTPPLAQTFCSLSSAENILPSYQNERFIASPDTSPASLSGRRNAARRVLVSCRRGLCSGTSSNSSSASRANALARARRSLICRTSASARGSMRPAPAPSSGSMRGAGGSEASATGSPPRQPVATAASRTTGTRYRVIEVHHYRRSLQRCSQVLTGRRLPLASRRAAVQQPQPAWGTPCT